MRQLTVYCPHGLAMATTAEISQLTSPENIYGVTNYPTKMKNKHTQFVLQHTFTRRFLCVYYHPSWKNGLCFFFPGLQIKKENSEKKPPHHHLLVFFPKDLSRGTCWRLKGLPRSRWVTVSRFSRRAGKRNQQWRFFSPNRNDGLEDCICIYIYILSFFEMVTPF